MIIIAALISEFSPYILHNYLLSLFPFLTNYTGRGLIYISIGIIYITPEVGFHSNVAGFIFLVVGLLCILMNLIISSNTQNESNDLIILSKNYEDFSNNSLRESLNFPINKGVRESYKNSVNIK